MATAQSSRVWFHMRGKVQISVKTSALLRDVHM